MGIKLGGHLGMRLGGHLGMRLGGHLGMRLGVTWGWGWVVTWEWGYLKFTYLLQVHWVSYGLCYGVFWATVLLPPTQESPGRREYTLSPPLQNLLRNRQDLAYVYSSLVPRSHQQGERVWLHKLDSLAEALKPCNYKYKNVNWRMNLIVVPSHGRDNGTSWSCSHCTIC